MAESFLDFTNSDAVLAALNKAIGRLIVDVTGYQVVEADETIPKATGNFVLVDLTALNPLDWATNEVVDEDGILHTAHNYLASITLTAYRGKPHWALSRVHQAFGLSYLREKYFPTGSPFAYSSSSTIARMRIPLNQQLYENRARVLINFNVTFVEKDVGTFEDIDQIIIGVDVDNDAGTPPQHLEAIYDKDEEPGGTDPGLPPPPNPPIVYHDTVAEVCVETPVIDRPALISDAAGD